MNTMEKYEKRLDEEQWGELYNKEQAEQVINGILTEQVFCWTDCARSAAAPDRAQHICKSTEER